MFCRFCGGAILFDSQFCSHCGKLLANESPRRTMWVRKLSLRTPYPYAAVLFLAFLTWALQPGPPPFDYQMVRIELELTGRSGDPAAGLYRHQFSLVVENVGDEVVRSVPVELRARAATDAVDGIEADFLGRRVSLLGDSGPQSLVVYLDDAMAPADRRRYTVDLVVSGRTPFSVTYEIASEDSSEVLATFSEIVTEDSPPEPEEARDELSVPGGRA